MASNEKRTLQTNAKIGKPDKVILIEEDDDDIEMKLNDIRSKMIIAHNIVTACAKESTMETESDFKSLQNKAEIYARVPVSMIKEVKKLKKPYKFKSLSHITIEFHTFIALCVNVRHIIIEYYLKKRVIPSLHTIDDYFRTKGVNWKKYKFIRKNIFQYHRLPGLESYLIIENPELVAKRTNYLKKIRQYREEGRYIVYVNEKRLDTSKDAMSLDHSHISKFVMLAASTREGWIQTVFNYYTKINVTEQWFRYKMLPHVSEPCVFVILNQPNQENVPPNITPSTSKEILTDWLKRRNIPYNPSSHKADLYTLFKKYKGNLDSCYSSRLDELIKHNGHEVLYVPHGYPKLNYFYRFWAETEQKIEGYATSTQYLNMIIEASDMTTLEYWRDLEKDIVHEEMQMLKEERELEDIIDNILTMVRDKSVTKFDLPSQCSTEVLDFLDDKVNNIVVD